MRNKKETKKQLKAQKRVEEEKEEKPEVPVGRPGWSTVSTSSLNGRRPCNGRQQMVDWLQKTHCSHLSSCPDVTTGQ
jgi:hypothetical protein